ncbi:MAG: tRNA-binding protein [Planctomycetota bacterium]
MDTLAAFGAIDIRVARITAAEPHGAARRPAYVLTLDVGPELGVLTSSAQLTEAYSREDLVGRLVLAVVNLPAKRVAGVKSEALVLGVYSGGGDGPTALVSADERFVMPGDRVG